VHHGVDVVFGKQPADQLAIARVAYDELPIENRFGETGTEIVQHHEPFPRLAQLTNHVAADIAGTPRYQNCLSIHFPPDFMNSRSGVKAKDTTTRKCGKPIWYLPTF